MRRRRTYALLLHGGGHGGIRGGFERGKDRRVRAATLRRMAQAREAGDNERSRHRQRTTVRARSGQSVTGSDGYCNDRHVNVMYHGQVT